MIRQIEGYTVMDMLVRYSKVVDSHDMIDS